MNALVKLLFVVGVAFSLPDKLRLPELKDGGVHWALLVAGSNGWMNYRHQADVCHAYQVLKKHGLPDERIVVMMVDDIAYHKSNPEPGVIINQPNGKNVYEGVPKDYTGLKNVLPDVFLDVLQGNKHNLKHKGSGKVIESGENDNIFVNFVDHGAPGLIAFGREFLHAKELNEVLKKMHSKKKYNKMLIYLETCESGSMFKTTLSKHINILAVTAANSTQSSYACYFDKKRKTFLGDVFSVKWMQDSDNENLNSETVEKQFEIVKHETNTSHVMHYGDLGLGDLMLSDFQGGAETNSIPQIYPDANIDAVPSEDVEIHVQKKIVNMADSTKEERSEAMAKIAEYKLKRQRIDTILKDIVSRLAMDHREVYQMMLAENEAWRLDCYQPVVEYLRDKCSELDLPFNGYALKQLRVMVNLCERPFSIDSITQAIDKVCDATNA